METQEAIRTVLVVEDSSAMRSLVRSWLEAEGMEVVEAKSGIQAIQLLQGHSFGIIITDINMPDLTGLELIRFARSTAAHALTPLIVISTDGATEDRKRAMDLGANAYLVKPFGAEDLVVCVKTYLAG